MSVNKKTILPIGVTPEEVNQIACEYNISAQNEPFCVLATYGALMDVNGDMFARIQDEYRRAGKKHRLEKPEDIEKYFLGFGKIPNLKLTFQKRVEGSETDGKATLVESFGQECFVALWAVPRSALKPSSALMQSEGCISGFDLYHERNQYVLRSNITKGYEPVENLDRPMPNWLIGDPSSFYLFLAAEKYLVRNDKLFPDQPYADKIIGAYRKAQELGYEIPDGYIAQIEREAMIK